MAEGLRAEAVQVKYYKQLLIYCVAGLDRGSAANEAAASEVEIAVSRLQSATSPVVLSWTSGAALACCCQGHSLLLGTTFCWQICLGFRVLPLVRSWATPFLKVRQAQQVQDCAAAGRLAG